jgi:hypothetical protein
VILAVGPALVVALGVFGHMDSNAAIAGAPIIVWVGGWLAQFAAFFWLMAIARKQNFAWWFIASGATWAADWTMPASPVFLILWPVAFVATALWIAHAELSYEAIAEHGIRATGIVEQVYQPMMNVIINNAYIKRKLRLRIERSDGTAPYEATYNGLFTFGEIPSVGARIPFLVDPSNPRRKTPNKARVHLHPAMGTTSPASSLAYPRSATRRFERCRVRVGKS